MSVTAVFSETSDGEEEVHPVHKEWIESVADSTAHLEYASLPAPLNKTFCNGLSQLQVGHLPESDVYLLEKPKHLYFLPRLKRKAPESTIIYIHATCRFLGAKRYPRIAWGKKWPIGYIERSMDGILLKQLLKRYVDCVITVSEPLKKQIEGFANLPTRIVHPYVPRERAERFEEVSHSPEEKKITMLAENRPRKGVELAVSAWQEIADDFGQYTLEIAGRGQVPRFDDASQVSVRGFVDSLPDFFSSSDLHVHPAYCDPFPVSTIEAMMAGVPTIVSKYSGTRKLSSQVSRDLVVDTTKESVQTAMRTALERQKCDRDTVRGECREVASDYKKGSDETDFASRFDSLLNALSN